MYIIAKMFFRLYNIRIYFRPFAVLGNCSKPFYPRGSLKLFVNESENKNVAYLIYIILIYFHSTHHHIITCLMSSGCQLINEEISSRFSLLFHVCIDKCKSETVHLVQFSAHPSALKFFDK